MAPASPDLGRGLFSYAKMGKLEDAPFTIKQAWYLPLIPAPPPRKFSPK